MNPSFGRTEPTTLFGLRLFGATIVIGLGVTLSTMTASIVFISLPTLATSFSVDISVVQWVVMVYFITVSSLHLSVGRIADLLGRRAVYQVGFIIFVLGSALSGLSHSIQWLIAARIVQAIGASIIQANGPAILTYIYSPEKRGQAMGYFGVFGAVGFLMGPLLGGLLLSVAGWPIIFFALIPIAAIALLAGQFTLPSIPATREGSFDLTGAVLIACILAPAVYALNRGFVQGWSSAPVVGAVGTMTISVVLLYLRERSTPYPLIDLKLFRTSEFRTALIVALLGYISLDSINLLMPFFLEQLMGATTAMVGLIMASVPLMAGLAGVAAGYISDRLGPGLPRSVGLLGIAFGLMSFSLLGPMSGLLPILVGLVLVGIGRGFFMTPNSSVMMGALPRERLGTAGGFVAASRTFGRACGQALWGGLFGMLVASMVGGGGGGQIGDMLNGYRSSFLVAGGVALLASIISLWRTGSAR